MSSNLSAIKLISLAAWALTGSCVDVPSHHDLWKVPPRLDASNHLAWRQLPAQAVRVDRASDSGRTFSHHPFIYNVGGTLYLLFSASATDVDGMGQSVEIASSSDAGLTWSKPVTAFPPALLPNQTSIQGSKYYCDRGIPQRALQPLTMVFLPNADEGSTRIFAVAQSSDNTCPGHYQAAGRIARELDFSGSSLFKGEPCWIETNDYTHAHQWANTVYGARYHMKICDQKEKLLTAVNEPDNLGPVATRLFNAPVIASDGKHNVSFPTKAVWHKVGSGGADSGYWQRFWSDVSVRNTTGSAWVEYSRDKAGKNWYPATETGRNIHETNIHQEVEKAHFGSFESSTQTRFLISNTGLNARLDQALLTIATSRGADPAFYKIGIVRGGDADQHVSHGTRPIFNSGLPGFYWPSATPVGDKLAVAYSENRETIWVSVLKESDLP